MKQRTVNSIFALISGILAGLCLIMFVDEAGAKYQGPTEIVAK